MIRRSCQEQNRGRRTDQDDIQLSRLRTRPAMAPIDFSQGGKIPIRSISHVCKTDKYKTRALSRLGTGMPFDIIRSVAATCRSISPLLFVSKQHKESARCIWNALGFPLNL